MLVYCVLTGLAVYYVVLWLWYRRADSRRAKEETTDRDVPENQAENYTLIGESRYKGGQIGTSQDKPGQSPQAVENDTIFTPQAAGKPDESVSETLPGADGTSGYGDDEPDYEDEEISGYMDGYDDTGRAAGVSFEELGETVRTANADNSTETEQRQAADTLARIEGTNLYDVVVENINGGLARVAELLKRNEAGLVTATVSSEAAPLAGKEYEAFNMNDFL